MAGNGCQLLAIAGNAGNGWKLLDLAVVAGQGNDNDDENSMMMVENQMGCTLFISKTKSP